MEKARFYFTWTNWYVQQMFIGCLSGAFMFCSLSAPGIQRIYGLP